MKPLIPNIPAIAITGSAGKSTTQAFIYSILSTKWKRILKTTKNLNLPSHTNQKVKRLKPSHQAVILEMAFGREAGKRHFRYIQPNMGVITNIGTAHYGKLGNSLESIAKSKSLLIKYMNPKGTLFINNDDQNSKLLETHHFKGKIVTVGIKNKADYQASHIKYLDNGMRFKVALDNQKETFFIPTFGDHNVINALFAIAVAHQLHFTPAEMRKGLKKFKNPARRLDVIPLPHQSLLIDDTFNANPQSVKAASDVLVRLGKGKKKIVVLGSMLELGQYSKKGHKEVGRYLAKKGIDAIYTYGKKAKWIGEAAIKKGFPAQNVHHFTNRQHLHNMLAKHFQPDSAILVKGSHAMKMYKTAEFLAEYSLRFSSTK
ncbi:UDP-N-acetylmuramoyl-tripeptide--D-alanyl-D-alanine ligase [Caldalkalibacillus uzonensis]|uniref:UDP-N-acetylmuramoyl-tripeptide--D-alanyl-D-alanine ligase n=1 Tax=Caldalkalibacillus uzonensis TaxID=353224 RepID=A0ABU0CRH5_9BACI|nr:UDP-N-acetylmuramoyl-tripeptide--D-alanyl-D-alanine ligase [Caldalkalibacillus uzonensis]MDQ0339023.1 UDP-N-acetylmuramoyl-tripeptide--D-alanyl-D-alanine ligase [Caldalkalibacillus uzonensis]